MLDGRWDVLVDLVLPNQAPRGNGVVCELRGACGACRRRFAARSWAPGLQLGPGMLWPTPAGQPPARPIGPWGLHAAQPPNTRAARPQ